MTEITIGLKDIKRFNSLNITKRAIADTIADAICGRPMFAKFENQDIQVLVVSDKSQVSVEELAVVMNSNTYAVVFTEDDYTVYKLAVIDEKIHWETISSIGTTRCLYTLALVTLFNRYYIIPEILMRNEIDKAVDKVESAR